MKIIAVAVAACTLAGCAYPSSSISQGSDLGHLSFVRPVGAGVRIDGQDRGVIAAPQPMIIDVTAGRHVVEETSGGQVVFYREYEVGAGSTVEIRSEN